MNSLAILIGFALVAICDGKDVSVSHPTVLLPVHYPHQLINFTIHLSSGCAKWISSRPNAVKLIPVVGNVEESKDTNCVSAVTLSAAQKEPQRIFSVVQADMKQGRPPLVSDVEVNVIKRISIVTTTKILYIGFPFTVFSVHAFDENENLFTNIEGIPFFWKVLPDESSKYPDHTGSHVLRILKWSEVSNEPPAAIEALEKSGSRGSSVVISGIKIGVAYIDTKITSPIYSNVPNDRVRVIVKDFLILKPSGFVAIIVDQLLEIETFNMNFNRRSKLNLPTDTYWLSLNSEKFLKLYDGTSSLKGLTMGESAVCVASTIPNDDSGPCVDVLVTEPYYGLFTTEPDHDWLLELGLQYEIQVQFYDRSDNLIHPVSLVAETMHENAFIRVDFRSKNGTYLVVTPLKVGHSKLFAQLKAVMGYKDQIVQLSEKFQVQKTQEFKIIEPVSVVPKRVGFIWLPNVDNSNSYQLAASGGSGVYKWESDNIRVVTVSKEGLIETAGTPGLSTITVTDRQMSHHFDTSRVLVGPPVKIILSPHFVEGQVNSDLLIPVHVFAAKDPLKPDELFEVAECSGLPFKVEFSNPDVFYYITSLKVQEEAPYNKGCALLWFNTTGPGFSQVTVRLQNIQNRTTLGGYNALEIKDFDDTIVLSLGASIKVTTRGGLLPWELDSSKFYRNVEILESNVINQLPGGNEVGGNNVFTVVCNAIGESLFIVTSGNKPTATNKFPKLSSAVIGIKCSPPTSLRIMPVPEITSCPPYRSLHSESLPVLVNENQGLLVVAKESSGLMFGNFSSLQFSISGCSEGVKINTETFPYINVMFRDQIDCNLAVSLAGYRKFFMYRELYEPIAAGLKISAKMVPHVESSEISVFNHPSSAKTVQISGGSGFFTLATKNGANTVSEVNYDSKSSQLTVTPITDGREMVTISDVCFPSLNHLQFEVIVSSIGTINVKSKKLMPLNSTDILEVQVMDSNGYNIEASMFSVIKLTLITSNNVIQFKHDEVKQVQNKYSKFYRMTAKTVGVLQLHFIATLSSGQITSRQHEIQVFSPLSVTPSVVYMVPGQFYLIKTTGGPQPLPALKYKLNDKNIGTVKSSGLFEALKVGSCMVNVEIVDHNDLYVLSKASVQFHVVELNTIELHVALSQFPTESIVPVYVTGNNGKLTPLTLNRGLNFEWSVANRDVIEVIPQHEFSGIDIEPEANFAVRIVGRNAGNAVLKVAVSQKPGSSQGRSIIVGGQILIAEANIEVYQRLELLEPKHRYENKLLMTPNSVMYIKSNLNFANFEAVYHSDQLVSVDHRGLVTAGEKEGLSVVLVRSSSRNGVNQTFSLIVAVKHIAFIRIQTESLFKKQNEMEPCSTNMENRLKVIPQGTSINMRVSFHDDRGHTFDSVNAKVKYELNRNDIGQVNLGSVNHSLVFRNSDLGISALKASTVSNDAFKTELSDYLVLNVGNVIDDSRFAGSLQVGDVVCLRSPFRESVAAWSANSDVLQVNSESGLAIAVASGDANLKLAIGDQKTYKVVKVANSGRFELSPRAKYDAVFPSEIFHFDLRKSIFCDHREALNQYRPDLSWLRCSAWFDSDNTHLNPQLIATATFDAENGISCELQVKPTTTELRQALASVSTSVNIQATILPTSNRLAVSSPVIKINFAPLFHVSSSSIILSNHYPSAEIFVKATTEVVNKLEVIPTTQNLFTVKKVVQDNNLKLAVELSPNAFSRASSTENLVIELKCGLTGKSEKINVYIQLAPFSTESIASKPSGLQYFNENFIFYIPILITLLCLLFGYYIMMLYKQQNKLIDISLNEGIINSPRRVRMNDNSFYPGTGGAGDAAGTTFLNRSGSPGATPYPFARMRKMNNLNRSSMNSMDDSMNVPGSPWGGGGTSGRSTSPGRVQLWSQSSPSPHAAKGS